MRTKIKSLTIESRHGRDHRGAAVEKPENSGLQNSGRGVTLFVFPISLLRRRLRDSEAEARGLFSSRIGQSIVFS
jgi:hypothetical protein